MAGPLGQELFRTLTDADGLLQRMRADSATAGARVRTGSAETVAAAPGTVPVSAHGQGPTGSASTVSSGRSRVRAGREGAWRTLSAASVPRLLLTVGALCLLVAAVVFLAVTWAALGVGGRTGVLVMLTAACAALTAWSARRGLRAAVESLGAVTAGFGCLDVVGAWSAGWLGVLSDAGLTVLLGVLLTTAGAAAAAAIARTPTRRFRVGEVAVTIGVASMALGLGGQDWGQPAGRMLVATAVAAAVGTALATSGRLHLPAAAAGAGAVAGLSWLATVATAVDRLGAAPTMSSAWLHAQAWPLLAAAALPAAVAGVRRLPTPVRVAAVGTSILGLAALLGCPAWGESSTAATLVAVVTTTAASAVLLLWPRPWAAAGLGLALVGGAAVAARSLQLLPVAVERLGNTASMAWAGTPGGRLPDYPGPVAGGWVLPLCLAALALLAPGSVRLASARPHAQQTPPPSHLSGLMGGRRFLVPALAVAALVATATLALGVAPVWLVVGVPLGAAAVGTLLALRADGFTPAASVAVLLLVAVPVAAYDEVLCGVALTVTLLLTAALHVGSPDRRVRDAAGAVAPTALAGLVWTCGALSGAAQPWTALTALLLLAAVLLGRTLPEGGRSVGGSVPLELGCAPAAVLAAVLGLQDLADGSGWLAVYLTVAGAAATALALLREDRRQVSWLGGLLLATASWVRLADLGVTAPEPYTVPTATALLILGWSRLRREPRLSTLTALGPGLGLALVPSLLWAWEEPLSSRALGLGVVCLALVVAGLRGRWSALVLYGAAVGAVLVVREAAPYVGHSVPRWLVIGGAGALLTGLGLTWERRVAEARAVGGYLRGLR